MKYLQTYGKFTDVHYRLFESGQSTKFILSEYIDDINDMLLDSADFNIIKRVWVGTRGRWIDIYGDFGYNEDSIEISIYPYSESKILSIEQKNEFIELSKRISDYFDMYMDNGDYGWLIHYYDNDKNTQITIHDVNLEKIDVLTNIDLTRAYINIFKE